MDDIRLVLLDGWVDFYELRGKIIVVIVDDELNFCVIVKLVGEGEIWKDIFYFCFFENY